MFHLHHRSYVKDLFSHPPRTLGWCNSPTLAMNFIVSCTISTIAVSSPCNVFWNTFSKKRTSPSNSFPFLLLKFNNMDSLSFFSTIHWSIVERNNAVRQSSIYSLNLGRSACKSETLLMSCWCDVLQVKYWHAILFNRTVIIKILSNFIGYQSWWPGKCDNWQFFFCIVIHLISPIWLSRLTHAFMFSLRIN